MPYPHQHSPIKFWVAFGAVVFLSTTFVTYAKAVYSHTATALWRDTTSSKLFRIPEGSRGRPTRRRADGGSRSGSCVASDPIVALIPGSGEFRTTVSHPTFWAYIPYQSDNFHSVRFSLWVDESDSHDLLYNDVPVSVSTAIPGIIRIPLPTTGPGLEINQSYAGTLVIRCDEGSPDQDLFVEFAVTRVPESSALSSDLQRATSSYEQAIAYGQNGIWYDALTLLGNAHATTASPQVTEAWRQMLTDVGLSDMATKPVVDCCVLDQ